MGMEVHDVNRIRPAFCTLNLVMESINRRYGERTAFPFRYLHQIPRVMVSMLMAAEKQICGLPKRFLAPGRIHPHRDPK